MMIGRVVGRLQLRETAMRLTGSGAHRSKKFLRTYMRRTRTRNQTSARRNVVQPGLGQLGVSPNGPGTLDLAFCERRRVEHNEIELAPGISREPLKSVGLDGFRPTRSDGGGASVEH